MNPLRRSNQYQKDWEKREKNDWVGPLFIWGCSHKNTIASGLWSLFAAGFALVCSPGQSHLVAYDLHPSLTYMNGWTIISSSETFFNQPYIHLFNNQIRYNIQSCISIPITSDSKQILIENLRTCDDFLFFLHLRNIIFL